MHIFRKCNLKYSISWKCLQTSFSHRSHYFDKICRNACLKSSFALLPPFLFPTGTLFPRVHFSHGYTFPTGTLKGSIRKNRQLPMWQVTFLVSIFQIFRMVASVTDILDAFNSYICLVFSVSIIAQGSSILKKCSQFREYSWILYFQLEMKKCTLQTWLTNSVWLYRCRYRWVFKQPV